MGAAFNLYKSLNSSRSVTKPENLFMVRNDFNWNFNNIPVVATFCLIANYDLQSVLEPESESLSPATMPIISRDSSSAASFCS